MTRILLLHGGGLDSRLARAVLALGGVEVEPVHLDTGFVHAARSRAVDDDGVERIDVARDYLREVVLAPRHGYGAGLNACIDCRAFLLRRAAAIATARGIDAVATGEIVGQRALDQSRHALDVSEREAGVAARVVRPLSAGPDAPAGPRLAGRGRAGQRALARSLGLDPGPAPGGGCCVLSDRAFSRRLRDLVEHRDPATIGRADLERLRVGRHYRIDWAGRLVVGRDEAECRWLESHAGPDWVCGAADGRGAVGVLDGDPDGERGRIAAAIVARHAGVEPDAVVPIDLRRPGEVRRIDGRAAGDRDLARWRV
jgi:hypothetical protein